MSKEVLQAIKAICDEKHIPVESVLATIEQALAAAYRKDFGNKLQNLKVDFNPETMGIRVFDVKTVVEDQELDEEGKPIVPIADEGGAGASGTTQATGDDDKEKGKRKKEKESGSAMSGDESEEEEEKRFNPKTDIMISEAKEKKPSAELGEEIVTELEVPGEFGRMAAQTAKQVIIQRLREAERDVIFKEYKDKEGTIVNGSVQRIEHSAVLVDIGQATAVLPPSEQVSTDRYAPGMQLRVYIKSVATSSRGPEVIVSRASKELVRELFTMEVPEIAEGVVEIKAIAREPGSRVKIAVHTTEENVDPVGSCVGQRGTRVQFIINELGGEKIDIIEWDADEVTFIKQALSPAKVQNVELNEETKEAAAIVVEDQFSLAIGKRGQNVRLASQLTGWKIDIKQAEGGASAEEESTEAENTESEAEADGEEKEKGKGQKEKVEEEKAEKPEAESAEEEVAAGKEKK